MGTTAAIAMKRASARSPGSSDNNEGYRSSRGGVSGCFTRWPALPPGGSRSGDGEPQDARNRIGWLSSAWAGSAPRSDRARRHAALRSMAGYRLPASYWITSSAVANSVSGMVRPRVLAILRLMTNSNLVGCWTGKVSAFSPPRMRPV